MTTLMTICFECDRCHEQHTRKIARDENLTYPALPAPWFRLSLPRRRAGQEILLCEKCHDALVLWIDRGP